MNKYFFIIFLLIPFGVNAALTCHLHPPNDSNNTDSSVLLRGPYTSQKFCEKENNKWYKMKGRCHCVFSDRVMPFLSSPKFNDNNRDLLR